MTPLNLGQLIAARRVEIGIDLYVVAQRLEAEGIKLSRSTLYNWENNKQWNHHWSPDLLNALALVFETTTIELLARLGLAVPFEAPLDYSPMTFGELICTQRTQLGMEYTTLARKLEELGISVSRSTLQHWETAGEWDIHWNGQFLRALAAALETTEVDLLRQLGFPVSLEDPTAQELYLLKRMTQLPEPYRDYVARVSNHLIDTLPNLQRTKSNPQLLPLVIPFPVPNMPK